MKNCATCDIIKIDIKYKYCITCFINYRRWMKYKDVELHFLPESEDEEE